MLPIRPEAERTKRAARLRLLADRRLHLPDGDGGAHSALPVSAGSHLLLALVVGVEQTLRHEALGGDAPPLGHFVGALQRLEPGDRGAGDVDVVGRAQRLAQDVVHAGLFEDDPGGASGDHAGTVAAGFMRTRPPPVSPITGWMIVEPASGTVEEVALGFLGALLDRQRHLLGLAVSEADTAVAVTDHDERGEAEATTALDDLGDTVDRDDPRLAQATFVVTIVTIVIAVSHQNSRPALS